MPVYVEETRATSPAHESDGVTVPGERRAARRADASSHGGLLPKSVWTLLWATARAFCVATPSLA